MVKAVIFDIDGTLIDSNDAHAESFVKAFNKFNKKVSFEEIRCLIGMGADDVLEKFLNDTEIRDFGDELKEYRKSIFLKEYLPKIQTFPKLKELFTKIRDDGKKIALASSASKEELAKYDEKLGVSDLCETETNSDDAEKAKPAPDIFEAAVRKLKNIEKQEIVVVGDTPYDAKAAIRSNLKIIGVESGGWTKDKLLESGCSEVYQDIAQLLDHYNKSKLQ